MSQFTIIITEDIQKTNISIKQGRGSQLEEKSKTYIVTEDDHRILLKPPKLSQLTGYEADVVINETTKHSLTDTASKPGGITVNLHEDQSIDIRQKAREKAEQEHMHGETEVEAARSGNQKIYRCKKCSRSLGTEKEIRKWFEKEIL